MEIRILKLTIQQTLSPPYLPYLICINATRFNRHIPRLAIDAGAIEGIFPYPTGVSVIDSAGMMPLHYCDRGAPPPKNCSSLKNHFSVPNHH